MIFLSLKNACTFLLVKEKTWKSIFNTNSELSQNRTEKQIMPFKTTVNWLFNDIWYYLVIGSFDWKIGVFQQIVVRVYYILKASYETFANEFFTKKIITRAYSRSSNSLGFNHIFQKFSEIICEIIFSTMMCGSFLTFWRSRFINNFVMKNNFSEP